MCFGCTLMNVKVGDTRTGISMTSIVTSIDWATYNGAQVINMSFENGAACTQASFPALRDAIARARDNGVNLVAAAGNYAVNVDNVTPASCPGVISAAASDRTNTLAPYSSRGPNIGVTAPGGASCYGAGISCPADASSGFNASDVEGVGIGVDNLAAEWQYALLPPSRRHIDGCAARRRHDRADALDQPQAASGTGDLADSRYREPVAKLRQQLRSGPAQCLRPP